MYALRQYTLPLTLAVLLHAGAVWALMQGFQPEQDAKAFAKPPPAVMANLIVMERKAKPPPPKPKPAPDQTAAQKKIQQEAQKKALQEAQAKEKARQEALQKEAERKAAEEARKAQEQEERLQRLSELADSSFDQAIAQESADLDASDDDIVAQSYRANIHQLVIKNWSRPPSARNGMKAMLLMELIPTGDVVSVTVTESSGNAAFDRSAEQAVRRVGRFEVPADNTIFERHFRKVYLLFQPEDLLR